MKTYRNRDIKYTFRNNLKKPVHADIIDENWIKEKNMIKNDLFNQKEEIINKHFGNSLIQMEKKHGAQNFEWNEVCINEIFGNKIKNSDNMEVLISNLNKKKN